MRVPLHGATPAMSKPAFLFRPFLTQHKRSINTHCVLRIPNAPHPITNPTCRRRGTIIITASSSGVQRMPSSGDLRQRPPTQLPESFQLSIQQLQTLLDIGNRGAVYSAGVVTSMDELAAGLCTSKVRGIPGTAQDIQQRRSVYGINALPKPPTTTFWAYVQEALEDFTVRILIIAGVGSIILQTVLDNGSAGDGAAAGWIEGAAILAAVLVVVLVTAVNNYQKERQFMQLNDLQADTLVRVVRKGVEVEIPSTDIVVGDLMLMETGDILQADGVLVSGYNLRMDESNLTGESRSIRKDQQRQPAMYSGSKVLEGLGRMVCTAVGVNSQQGMIMALTTGGGEEAADTLGLREQTNLQNQLEVLAGQIGSLGLVAGVFAMTASSVLFTYDTFIVAGQAWEWYYLNSYLHFLILGITILVVAIPEGLPLAVTIGLAYSVKRMLTDNNLVRHLGAAETMGCATTICCDKTGTLTQNDMAVVRAVVGGAEVRDARGARQRLATRRAAEAATGGDNGNGSAAGEQGDTNEQQQLPESSLLTVPPPPAIHTIDPAACVLSVDNIDPRSVQLVCDAIAVNSTAQLVHDEDAGHMVRRGNPTECALLEFAEALGADILGVRGDWQVTHLFPFSSERKRMSTVAFQQAHKLDGMTCAKVFTKGAAEVVLSMCDNQLLPDGSVAPMSDEDKQQLLATFGKDGRRMLCIAYRDMLLPTWPPEGDPPPLTETHVEQHLTFLAMTGLEDPLRPEVKSAIRQLQRAGITVRMLTGDNAITAFSIARQCGIVPKSAPLPSRVAGGLGAAAWKKKVLEYLATQDRNGTSSDSIQGSVDFVSGGSWSTNGSLEAGQQGDEYLVMESSEFQKLILNDDGSINYDAFDLIWPRLRVLARCTPLDKYTIVKACKNRPTEVVAMTGDGTNDAPALRLANVGFAMASGTSIAKDASDILLLDDNLDSIVQAVKWGRNVYAGAAKFLQFQLTINVGAVIVATLGVLTLNDSPLAAIQMLWINLVMDSLASLSLATEAPSDDVLDQPPYATDASLVTPTMLKNIIGQTLFQLGVMYWVVVDSPAVLGYVDGGSVPGATVHYTMVFNTFVMMQLFNQVNARKLRDDLNILDGLSHDTLFLGVLASEAAIQFLLVQYGGQAFNCVPLTMEQWGVCIGFGAVGLLVRQALRVVDVEDGAAGGGGVQGGTPSPQRR